MSGIPNSFQDNLASVCFNIPFSLRLRTLAITVTPATTIVVVDDKVEFIEYRFSNNISHRINTNAFPDAPANFRHRQHVICADRRLGVLQAGALSCAWRLNCRSRSVRGLFVALPGVINQPEHKNDADNANNPFAVRSIATTAPRGHGFNCRRRTCCFQLRFGRSCFSLMLGWLLRR